MRIDRERDPGLGSRPMVRNMTEDDRGNAELGHPRQGGPPKIMRGPMCEAKSAVVSQALPHASCVQAEECVARIVDDLNRHVAQRHAMGMPVLRPRAGQ